MFDEIWILIPLAPFMLGGFALWSHHKRRELELMSTGNDQRAEHYAAQNEQLEQRVQVLERIIIEQRNDLAQSIEDLRDTPVRQMEKLK